MSVTNAITARAWAGSWVTDRANVALGLGLDELQLQGSNVRRFRRTATEQDGLALMCDLRQPTAAKGHREAATALREMADNLERGMTAAGFDLDGYTTEEIRP